MEFTILFTGQYRDSDTFVEQCERFLAHPLVSRVLWVTGDDAAVPGLPERVERVQTTFDPGFRNIMAQLTCLLRGLDLITTPLFLKTRPDVAIDVERVFAFLETALEPNKIWTPWSDSVTPFYMEDAVYAGTTQFFRERVSTDPIVPPHRLNLECDFLDGHLHVRLFGTMMWRAYPRLTRLFVACWRRHAFNHTIEKWTRDGLSTRLRYRSFVELIREYIKCIDENFVIHSEQGWVSFRQWNHPDRYPRPYWLPQPRELDESLRIRWLAPLFDRAEWDAHPALQ